MSDQPGSDRSLYPISGIFVVVAAIGGYLWLSQPLQSFRPREPRKIAIPSEALQSTEARLWQDPFQAVFEHETHVHPRTPATSQTQAKSPSPTPSGRGAEPRDQAAGSPSREEQPSRRGSTVALPHDEPAGVHSMEALANGVRERSRSGRVTILGVLVRGGPYVEDGEYRRRQRQAVVSALAVKGYVPGSSERIAYLDLATWHEQEKSPFRVAFPVPYEWFASDRLNPRSVELAEHVVVVWLNEMMFAAHPLGKLDWLLRRILRPSWAAHVIEKKGRSPDTAQQAFWDRFHLRLLGPASSNTLAVMLDEKSRTISEVSSPSFGVDPMGKGGEKYGLLVDFLNWYLDYAPTEEQVAMIKEELPAAIAEASETDRSTDEKPALDALSPEEAIRAGHILRRRLDEQANKAREEANKAGKQANKGREESIEDSDEGWAETALLFYPYILDTTSLVQAADEYLDDGLTREQMDSLQKAITPAPGSWSPGGLSEEIRNALPEVVDSDEFWYEAVVAQWMEGVFDQIFESLVQYDEETEDAQLASKNVPYTIDHLTILSSRATASPAMLVRAHQGVDETTDSEPESEESDLEKTIAEIIHEKSGATFVTTVLPDDRLAEAVVEEFIRRGVDLASPGGKDHLVLVGEWDTFYGRTLPLALAASIHAARAPDLGQSTRAIMNGMLDGSIQPPPRVHQFAYLRGVDGSLPGAVEAPADEAGNAREPAKLADVLSRGSPEPPLGRGQLDHIRRLATQLLRLDDRLRRHGGGEIRAIGVVGTDLYDKQLVLQALSEKFPGALFFTTDLDARLFHSSQYPWSRNLVIASSFGLSLHRNLQKHIPPFRDTYQTSTFLAGLVALGGAPELEAMVAGNLGNSFRPRLMEVSRSGVEDLTPDDPAGQGRIALHPDGESRQVNRREVVGGVLIVALLGAVVLPMSARLRRVLLPDTAITSRQRLHGLLFVILAITAVCALMLAVHLSNRHGTGEPFAVFEGISIWPTEFLRLVAALFSLYFFLIAGWRIHASNCLLQERYIARPILVRPWRLMDKYRERVRRFGRESTFLGLLTRPFRALRVWLTLRCLISPNTWRDAMEASVARSHGRGARKPVRALWRRYMCLGRWNIRCWRFIPMSLAFWLLGSTMIRFFGRPYVPYRGTVAFLADRILLLASVGSLLFLTFFIVDATRLCEVFIRSLYTGRARFDAECRRKRELREQFQVDSDDERFSDVLDSYLVMELTGSRTEVIGTLAIYPFVPLLLMLLSRLNYFDRWDWPIPLILVFIGLSTYVVACWFILRRAAERLRARALQRASTWVACAADRRGGEGSRRMEMLVEEIRNARRGAFSSWTKSPAIRGVLIPFGGLGAVGILELASMLFS